MCRKQRPQAASFSAFSNPRAPHRLRWVGLCCLLLLAGCWSNEAEKPEPLPLPTVDPQIVVRPAPPLVAGDFARVRNCRLIYQATITDLIPGTKARIWMPEPISDSQQRVTRKALQTPDTAEAKLDEQSGNAWFYIQAQANDRGEILCGATYTIERVEGLPGAGEQISPADVEQYLQAEKTLPADAELVARLKPEIAALKNPGREGTWQVYISLRAVQPTLELDATFFRKLVGTCRAVGIPARCQSGLSLAGGELEPKVLTWAEVAVEGRWQAVHDLEVRQANSEQGIDFATLSPERVRFSTICAAPQTPAPAGTQTQGLVWPYVEVDGKPYAKVKTRVEIKEVEGE